MTTVIWKISSRAWLGYPWFGNDKNIIVTPWENAAWQHELPPERLTDFALAFKEKFGITITPIVVGR